MKKADVYQVRQELTSLIDGGSLNEEELAKVQEIRDRIIEGNPLDRDPWIYRIVVVFLGLIVTVTAVGGVVIAVIGRGTQTIELSEGIIAIGSAAVGALAGLLAPTGGSRD